MGCWWWEGSGRLISKDKEEGWDGEWRGKQDMEWVDEDWDDDDGGGWGTQDEEGMRHGWHMGETGSAVPFRGRGV